ncbi:hypothetical protein B0T20DRAFT_116496 [Sordaria brevicollis]|uniref:BTB domain-containing protein n=1 Tax=Sordaria brevicollis TaxID=83679 RepID=A0AAE0UFI6_SORBR|nr:hypothetical protein B0T20DRAFT_116496 [Sordaria brevicollis]
MAASSRPRKRARRSGSTSPQPSTQGMDTSTMTARITQSPDYDLALVVGPEKERILASSVVLRFASPVFAAMLSPPWVEGQGLAGGTGSGTIKEIELPEDNAEAMEYICAVIHHQEVDDTPTESSSPSRDLLKIAILTDKYDLHKALRFVLKNKMDMMRTKCPLEDWAPRKELWAPEANFQRENQDFTTAGLGKHNLLGWRDLLNLAATAYLLNDCISFHTLTFNLMAFVRPGSFTALLDKDLISSVLPLPKLALLLAERAAKVRYSMLQQFNIFNNGTYILRIFDNYLAYTLAGTKALVHSGLQADCTCDEPYFQEFFKEIGQHGQDLKLKYSLCISDLRPEYSCDIDHKIH